MLGFLSILAGMIPGLSTLVTGITTAWFNSKVQITKAKIGGDTEVAKSLVIAASKDYATNVDRLKVIAGSKVLLLLIVGFATPWIVYEWKIVVWDTILGWGTTPPVKGLVAEWGGTIIACLFGSGTALTVGHMYFNRKDQ